LTQSALSYSCCFNSLCVAYRNESNQNKVREAKMLTFQEKKHTRFLNQTNIDAKAKYKSDFKYMRNWLDDMTPDLKPAK